MKKWVWGAALLIGLAAIIGVLVLSSRESSEASAIRESFEAYRKALLEQDGEAASEWVSQSTIDMYEHQVSWARTASRDEVLALGFMNRLQIALLRQQVPRDTLRIATGRSMFAYAVDKGWISRNSVLKVRLGEIREAYGKAVVTLWAEGKKTNERFFFVKENGRWGLDLTKTFQGADVLLQQQAKRQGLTENAFILLAVEALSG